MAYRVMVDAATPDCDSYARRGHTNNVVMFVVHVSTSGNHNEVLPNGTYYGDGVPA